MTDNLLAKVYYPTGDEPYYLLMAHSLIHDGDLELTNNFMNKDYWHYYPGELYPRHESLTKRPGLWSKHSPGVPLLIAPGYALLDWRGAAYTINVLAALLAVNIYLLAKEVSGRRLVALFVWAALCLTNPLASYASLIFPATPAALLTVYAYRQIASRQWPLAEARWPRLSAALGIAFLPWLNPQLLPIAFGLFLYGTLRLRGDLHGFPEKGLVQPHLAALLGPWLLPLVISGSLFLGYYYFLYESFLPNWHDHAGSADLPQTLVALVGTFFDRQWGLLIYSPSLILSFIGLAVMVQKNRRQLAWLAAISLPYFLLITNYRHWWGEWCPPGRYLVPLVALLTIPMAYAVPALNCRRFLAIYGPLVIFSALVMRAFIINPRLMYNHPDGQSSLFLWLAQQGGPNLLPWVPTFFIKEELAHNLALASLWGLAAGAIIVWGWRCATKPYL